MTSQRPKPTENDRLQSILAKFERDNATLRQRVAELEAKNSEHWVPLKSADRGPYSYNSVRRWAERGLIKTRHVGGRVFVEAGSLRQFMAMRSSFRRG